MFVNQAAEIGLDEICLLEHNFQFEELALMYDFVYAHREFMNEWFHWVGGMKRWMITWN